MTVHQLYKVVQEIEFGTANTIYICYENFNARKFIGPMLTDLLELIGVKCTRCNSSQWYVKCSDTNKCLVFQIGKMREMHGIGTYISVVYV